VASDAGGGPAGLAHAPTFGIEAVICHGSNNYAPRQQPEKLIPLCLLNALNGDSLPRNGDGRHIRNYVNDVSRAPPHGAARRAAGPAYTAGGPTNARTSRWRAASSSWPVAMRGLIEYVRDRAGHDRRYSLSSEKIRWELGSGTGGRHPGRSPPLPSLTSVMARGKLDAGPAYWPSGWLKDLNPHFGGW
jgi:dTDP-glucose 4,6-dehydratase